MKVLIVCHDYKLSGANRSLVDWLSLRDKSELDVTVLIPHRGEELIHALEKEDCKVWVGNYYVPVKHIRHADCITKLKDYIKLVYSLLLNPIIQTVLLHKIRKQHFDIVHSNSFATVFGVQLAMKAGLPHIWHIREFMEEDHGISHYKCWNIDKCCANSYAICISPVIEEKYKSAYKFKGYTTIFNRIAFDREYVKKRKFMEDGVCNMIIAGYLSEGKGQSEAILATDLLRQQGFNVELYICGQGEYSVISPYINKTNSKYIHYLGYRGDLIDLRKKMDIALICSKMEALGRVTIESLYYENMVIGADTGCTPYIIHNGKNGLIYRKGDKKDLAEKIKYCFSHSSVIGGKLKSNQIKAVDLYANDISMRILNYYRRVLGGK